MATFHGEDTPAIWRVAVAGWASVGRTWDEVICRPRLEVHSAGSKVADALIKAGFSFF